MAVTLSFATISLVQQPVQAQGAGGLDALGALNDNAPITTCALDNIGWLICPVLRSAAKAGDYAFTFIAQSFLAIEPALFSSEGGTIKAWGVMRNIANVVFVVMFLVVIYSLLTGRGVGNYNIKRMLPRFIVGAILVNISFFICQLMVDISNIAGRAISGALGSVASSIGTSGMPIADKVGSDSAPVLTEITSGILAKVDVSWVLLAPVTAVVMLVALICSVLIVVLIVRKTLIVALILLSPLAFVAYLLPNTEQYFTRWLRLLSQALLLFPVIAILLGAGQIVSSAIIQAGDSGYKVENDEYTPSKSGAGAGSQSSATVGLVAAGTAVLPLAGVWYVFKLALSGADMLALRVRRGGQRLQEHAKSAERREQAALQSGKKSMLMQGINRLQKLNAVQEGDTTAATSVVGRITSSRRTRKKTQKTIEQAQFDRQVQSRLMELRQKGGSAQENYTRALQQYRESQGSFSEPGDTSQLNINSYEGIELKAAEAYLLESIGRGASADASISAKLAAVQERQEKQKAATQAQQPAATSKQDSNVKQVITSSQDGSQKSPTSNSARRSDSLTDSGSAGGGVNATNKGHDSSGNDKYDHYSSSNKANKAAGISRAINRAADSLSSGDSANVSSAAAKATVTGASNVIGNVVIVPQGGSPAIGSAPIVQERRSADVVRPQQMTGTEIQAKARAAKYVMNAQEAQLAAADKDNADTILQGTQPQTAVDEESKSSTNGE